MVSKAPLILFNNMLLYGRMDGLLLRKVEHKLNPYFQYHGRVAPIVIAVTAISTILSTAPLPKYLQA
jgi:hypothetical protein